MKLCGLRVNESAKITNFPNDSNFTYKFLSMGIDVGCSVKCVLKPIFNSPILYFIKNSLIAVRYSDAKRIEVEYE